MEILNRKQNFSAHLITQFYVKECDSLKTITITIKKHMEFIETKRSTCMKDYIFASSREHLNYHLLELYQEETLSQCRIKA